MAHFTVTRDVIRRISEIETPHACALNEDISDEFPQRRMRGLHARRGVQRCTLLGSFSDAAERAHAVDGLNAMVHRTGYALTPVT
jgi:hypothetical protein